MLVSKRSCKFYGLDCGRIYGYYKTARCYSKTISRKALKIAVLKSILLIEIVVQLNLKVFK